MCFTWHKHAFLFHMKNAGPAPILAKYQHISPQCPVQPATDYRWMLFQKCESSLCAVLPPFPSLSLPPYSCTAYLLDPNLAEYLMLTVTYLMSDELPVQFVLGFILTLIRNLDSSWCKSSY